MTYSKELHDRVRENLHMFDYPRFDDGDIHGLLDEIERLQKLVDAKQNRCAELESRLDLYHGNMYDVACQENDKLQSALATARQENERMKTEITASRNFIEDILGRATKSQLRVISPFHAKYRSTLNGGK